MVDPFQLSNDVVQTTIAVAEGPLLWLFLFLFAWEDPETARSAGFGRRTFWLLLPGALLGSLVNLPFFFWSGDVLAVNFGGGVLPLLVSILVLRKAFAERDRLLAFLLIPFAAASGSQLVAVYLLPDGTALSLVVGGVAFLAPVVVFVAAHLLEAAGRRTVLEASLVLAFAEAAVFLTFLTTQTVPLLGIVSQFPDYLVAPLVLGALAGAVVPLVTGGEVRAGLAVAFAATTFGVLVGADLLREPPLYAPGSSAIYAIGGAGTSDLLYLSGPLALVAAYAIVRLIQRTEGARPAVAPSAAPETSGQLLRHALLDAVEGRPGASAKAADGAVSAAFAQSRQLVGLPEAAGPDREMDGLPVPAWITADRQNLSALARRSPSEPYEATRAWMTARWLVQFARGVSLRRFATRRARSIAYLLDLLFLAGPSVIGWYFLAGAVPGTGADLLASVPVNAAVFAFIAYTLVFFVVAETEWGTTPGKWLLGLRVTDRRLGTPGPVAALVRNLPKAVTITVVGYIGVVMAVIANRGTTFPVSAGGVLETVASLVTLVLLLIPGLGIPGGISVAVIGASPERQRIGDLWAGTWVVRVRPEPALAAWPVATPSSG